MSGRFSRSLELAKASFAVVRADKELMLLPVMSVFALIVIVLSLAVPVAVLGGFSTEAAQSEPLAMLGALIFYVVTYFVALFFNAALVGAAMIRMDGGNPTLGDGLRIAWARKGRILGYALIAATVGLILRAIEERVGWLGSLVVKLIGVAWAVATFLVVPVLVTRDVGPVGAVKESAELLRSTWGENLIGNGGLGLVFALVYVLLAFVGVGLVLAVASTGSAVAIGVLVALLVVAFIVLTLVHAALSGIYSAALYRFAAVGEGSASFTPAVLTDAFKVKA